MDISGTIAPKSDQLNADDLLSGPRTVRINRVKAGTSEQPVELHLDGLDGRPYKPGKSMRRVLIALWGSEAETYVGRRLTLFNDQRIKFGPDVTGGIRISHASDITKTVTIALTVTRGRRAPFTVEPLPDAPKPATGERVANAVKAIHATTTTDELAAIQRRIGADIANDSAIVRALDTQTKRLGEVDG